MIDLLATLRPSMPHFSRFSFDNRLAGIRWNSPMITPKELEEELAWVVNNKPTVPIWYDVKGRQPRVEQARVVGDHYELDINHPIMVRTPVPILFKAGADSALLTKVEGDGRHLVLAAGRDCGPVNELRAGESFHIRHSTFRIMGDLFTDAEKNIVKKVRAAGIKRWFLSYVEELADIDAFRKLIGPDDEIVLKIESKRGLNFAEYFFKKEPNLTLCAARGDMYVEISHPHLIGPALREVIKRDAGAYVGSRILLSVVKEEVPSCADFLELEWLADIGYHKMLLCDELCLKEELLSRAINAFERWRDMYMSPSVN